MGTFDPETRWRDPQLAKLPAMPDRERESIVLCMDELLFPFCGPEDILYSRCRIDPALLEYLNALDFTFQNRYHFDLTNGTEPLPEPEIFKQCMFGLALNQDASQLKESRLSPYAITADTGAYLEANPSLVHPLPGLETVVRVNSKIYSNQLLNRIGEKCYGTEVNSAAEMVSAGNQLLKQRAYLLKDPFGVSGKGNLLIDSETMQNRIAEHLSKQERSGLRCHFLLEPLLRKEIDFSSHWYIDMNGEKKFISVQQMINHQQNYSGSITADDVFIRLLETAGYFRVMDEALRVLTEDGYYGFVCFDSMILEDGNIVPIVEINARKSMGLINAYLDRRWAAHGHTGWLTFLSLGLPLDFTFERLLDALHASGILLTTEEGYGIVPLSSNTVIVNEVVAARRIAEGRQDRRGIAKGRLYASIVGRNEGHRSVLIGSLRQTLTDLSIKVYN